MQNTRIIYPHEAILLDIQPTTITPGKIKKISKIKRLLVAMFLLVIMATKMAIDPTRGSYRPPFIVGITAISVALSVTILSISPKSQRPHYSYC